MSQKRERSDFFVFIFLVGCSLGLFFFRPRIVFLERFFTAVESPFFALKNSTHQFLTASSGRQEIDQLKEQNRLLAVDQNAVAVCREENQKMARLLGSPPPVKTNFILAHVLGLSDALKIDRGENDGVKTGQAVIADETLIGRIRWVGATVSLVQLISDPGLKIAVITQKDGQTKAKGLLSRLLLDQVLQEEKLDKGDLVISTADGGWPPNLLIGTVSDVLPANRKLFRQAKIQPLVDYQKLNIVFIINQ
ncbi:MAG: rod shape-determining protein MreC [Candidatus Shapirobacteria bacterium]